MEGYHRGIWKELSSAMRYLIGDDGLQSIEALVLEFTELSLFHLSRNRVKWDHKDRLGHYG